MTSANTQNPEPRAMIALPRLAQRNHTMSCAPARVEMGEEA